MSYSEDLKGDAKVLKYGVYAKAVELLCFKSALEKLQTIYPEMDLKAYKKRVKHEYREMLALNLFRACAIWTKEITGTKEGSYIGRKHLHGGMRAATSMLQEFVDCVACIVEECRECMI